ncbi:histone deacetylase family protein [Sulfitobacter sp. F26169L]|uniref:histone deacetylase family protein n=1 Tax=Sulfitobacter sp. F26169L TaxID=2996015 RepID=UPI002260C6AE|nr:histone deacetylase family protein [Sulfitobacter sp. F26169L]MCX7567901.1 histone deacetylase family protein [Sulfitobacter sp. F26169L]
MKVFADQQRQSRHYPTGFLVNGVMQPNPEKPERMARLLAGVAAGGHEVSAPQDHGPGPISAIHTPAYLKFLSTVFARWSRIPDAAPEIFPNVHPDRRTASYPLSVVGQAGFHITDMSCPIGEHTWEAARWSANCAVSAADAVARGEKAAYALCRPPGHHCFSDLAGGFCYLNNSAIAAQYLRRTCDRVAIIDVDLHHGNGTQGIFYARDDVFTLSIHADPARFYPFFWGHAHETGEGTGHGYNLNIPLPRGTGDDGFLRGLTDGLDHVRAFVPDAVVVALGLDAFEGDPFGGLSVSTKGFAEIARVLAALDLPTVIVQEGGYLCDALGDNLDSFLRGFEGRAAQA